MTKCSVKNCKNHSSIRVKKDGVTYHRFPQNYELREKWRKLVAIDRNEEFYKPNKSSVICSCHFSESDMYLTKKGFRRLKKSAIPLLKELNEVTLKQEQPSSPETTNYVIQISDPDVISTKSSLSGTSSPLDSPQTYFYKKELRKCHIKLKLRAKQVINLKKQNSRLRKANFSLKKIIKNITRKTSADE